MKIKIECVIEFDETFWFEGEDGLNWFKSVLNNKEETKVILWSDDVGDEIGSTTDFKHEILKD